jgi:hypothetical protein
MDDEFYDKDGHDDGQFFADTEEEAHFFSVISDFADLLQIYPERVVMECLKGMIDQDKHCSLNSIN